MFYFLIYIRYSVRKKLTTCDKMILSYLQLFVKFSNNRCRGFKKCTYKPCIFSMKTNEQSVNCSFLPPYFYILNIFHRKGRQEVEIIYSLLGKKDLYVIGLTWIQSMKSLLLHNYWRTPWFYNLERVLLESTTRLQHSLSRICNRKS